MFQVERLLLKWSQKPVCSFVGTTAALIAGGLAAAGTAGSSAIASHAAGKAADTQASAAERAAELEHQDAEAALQFNRDVWNKQQENEKPFVEAGQGAVRNLSDLTKPGGGLMTPFGEQFEAPTEVTEQNDPGFQFRADQGRQAIERSAAAQGTLLTGGTLKSLTEFGQNYGSGEYQNVYNRRLSEFQQRYNIFQQNQANQFNRLATVAGIGQVGTAQLNSGGIAASGNNANILLGSGREIGQDWQNAAAARASGYVGSGNALSGGLSNLSNMGNLLAISRMFGGGTGTSTFGGAPEGWNPFDSWNGVSH